MFVKAFHPDLHSSNVRQGMQGQGFIEVVSDPESPLCQVKILMEPGKVSTPHIHRELHVYVTLDIDSPPVLTLAGDDLDVEQWLLPGGTLWIAPGILHVAILPRTYAGIEQHRAAIATENRVHPAGRLGIQPSDDVYTYHHKIPLLRQRIEELGLQVD